MKRFYIVLFLLSFIGGLGLLASNSAKKAEATYTPKTYVCHCESKECQTLYIAIPSAIAHVLQHDDDYYGQCKEVKPTPTVEPTPEVTPTIEPTVEPTREPEKKEEGGGMPPVFAGSTTEAKPCLDQAPVKTGANFHIYRNGEDVIAKWFPTEGSKAHIYYVNLNDLADSHALRNVDNDGYEDNLHLLGSKDWRFGLQQVNGCAGGPIVWVDDADTNGWTLFRQFYIWLLTGSQNMEKPRPTINDANWRRVSRTLDFILSYPVKEVVRSEPKPVEAHGGLTFGEYINDKKLDFPQGFTKGWWIGWDYGHICDKDRFTMARYATCPDWTEELVEKECKRVIEQILKFENPELLGQLSIELKI